MITRETATRIALAHAEIEAAEKLIEGIESEGPSPLPDLRAGFVNPRGFRYGIEMGVRTGDASMRTFDVSPVLALQVMRAHIENKTREIADLSLLALSEARS